MERSVAVILGVSFALTACSSGEKLMPSSTPPSQPSPDSQADYIGTATMEHDRNIVLRLRAPLDGGANFGEGYFRYEPGTQEYEDVLRHLGGLKPGQSKPVPPWPESPGAN